MVWIRGSRASKLSSRCLVVLWVTAQPMFWSENCENTKAWAQLFLLCWPSFETQQTNVTMQPAGRESDVLEPPTQSQQGDNREGKQPVKQSIDEEKLHDELSSFVNIKDNKKSSQTSREGIGETDWLNTWVHLSITRSMWQKNGAMRWITTTVPHKKK